MGLLKEYAPIPEISLRGNAEDYTDTHLGKLTIKYPVQRREKHLLWLAECECGTKIKVRASQIAIGGIDSCGRCQKLPYFRIPEELPYTLVDDEVPKQEALPLEYEGKSKTEDPSLNVALDRAFDGTQPDKEQFTAWDIAGECCVLLYKLNEEDRIKSLQLIRVQLGYEA